jgi:hypothetical protein
VIQELSNANEEIRTTSAWVLGTASQNNELVQNQVIAYIIQECILNSDSTIMPFVFRECALLFIILYKSVLIGRLPILAQPKQWHAKICSHQLVHGQRIGMPMFMAKDLVSL